MNREEILKLGAEFIKKHNEVVILEFGSWEKFIKIANPIRKERKNGWRKYTKEEVILYLQTIYKEKGKSFTSREYVNEKHTPSLVTIRDLFGTWSAAMREAGIPSVAPHNPYTYADEDIFNSLREFYEKYNEKGSSELYKTLKIKPSLSAIEKRFGTWRKALRQAGIEQKYSSEFKYNEENLIRCLKEAYSELGKLTLAKYDSWAKNKNYPSAITVKKKFGSWGKALYKANIPSNRTIK